ncbi:MAG: hypothetical protein AB1791_01920 [Chloroflexota bacterium]
MMIKLRLLLVLLLCWLFLFYNMERIQEVINIASFVYLLILVLMVFMLGAPRIFVRFTPATLVVSLGLYAFLKVVLQYPLLGVGLPITIIEVASILVTVLTFRLVTLVILDFEETIAEITINLLGLPPRLLQDDMEEIYRELRRARRYQLPMSLAVVKTEYKGSEVGLNQVVEEIQRGMRGRYLQAKLVRLLADHLHESDVIVCRNDDLVIALPHQEAAATRRALEGLNQKTREWGLNLQVGIASFPGEGATLKGLVEAAEQGVRPLARPDSPESAVPLRPKPRPLAVETAAVISEPEVAI